MSAQKYVYVGNIIPQYSDRISKLVPAKLGQKIKAGLIMLVIGLAFGGIVIGIGFAAEQNWLKWTGAIVGGLIVVAGVLMRGFFLKVSHCPYCDFELGKTLDDSINKLDENEKVECPNCREWLLSHKGIVRAFTSEDTAIKEWKFRAPVFVQGVWQNECVVCGAQPVRGQDLKKTKMDGIELLVGRISVSTATVSNVPYCNAHWNAVSLGVKDDHPQLTFEDFEARRRYVAVNKGKKAMKVKT
jgi:hypothetical protein